MANLIDLWLDLEIMERRKQFAKDAEERAFWLRNIRKTREEIKQHYPDFMEDERKN